MANNEEQQFRKGIGAYGERYLEAVSPRAAEELKEQKELQRKIKEESITPSQFEEKYELKPDVPKGSMIFDVTETPEGITYRYVPPAPTYKETTVTGAILERGWHGWWMSHVAPYLPEEYRERYVEATEEYYEALEKAGLPKEPETQIAAGFVGGFEAWVRPEVPTLERGVITSVGESIIKGKPVISKPLEEYIGLGAGYWLGGLLAELPQAYVITKGAEWLWGKLAPTPKPVGWKIEKELTWRKPAIAKYIPEKAPAAFEFWEQIVETPLYTEMAKGVPKLKPLMVRGLPKTPMAVTLAKALMKEERGVMALAPSVMPRLKLKAKPSLVMAITFPIKPAAPARLGRFAQVLLGVSAVGLKGIQRQRVKELTIQKQKLIQQLHVSQLQSQEQSVKQAQKQIQAQLLTTIKPTRLVTARVYAPIERRRIRKRRKIRGLHERWFYKRHPIPTGIEVLRRMREPRKKKRRKVKGLPKILIKGSSASRHILSKS